MATRGRPPKFGRPAALLALTLPQDTIEYLHGLDADVGWAIVKLVDGARGGAPTAQWQADAPPDVELLPIADRQHLIVVRAEAFRTLPGVSLVPLGHGRAFLAFPRHKTIDSLELAVIDRLDDDATPLDERARFAAFREVLRMWRQDRSLTFQERSIVVVERARPAARHRT